MNTCENCGREIENDKTLCHDCLKLNYDELEEEE